MILQETPGVGVVGGVGWGPAAKLCYRLGWQVEVGYFGAGASTFVEVVVEIFIVAGQLSEPTLVRCMWRTFKEVIVMLVRWRIVLTSWQSC